jgi:aerobic carbon-monoxide dehydrogenase small subunit
MVHGAPTQGISVRVNGQEHRAEVEPRRLLVDLVRDDLQLTGTHIGCEDGLCGACTVLVDGIPVKSCLMLVVEADGSDVETIEGLSSVEDLHPLQQAFSDEFALQCGFCTPGMIMSAKALLEANPDPDEESIRQGMVGNLCRCTGYQNIVRAIQRAASPTAVTGASWSQGPVHQPISDSDTFRGDDRGTEVEA